MSRKISHAAASSLLKRRPRRYSNTTVSPYQDAGKDTIWQLRLHGNVIAELHPDGTLHVSAAGWRTPTTKDRLNALPGVHVVQKDYQWYLNGVVWDGKWRAVQTEYTI